MSIVVLYCWCHSNSAPVLLCFTKEQKVCDIEIAVISFVVNGSVKFSIPLIDRNDALCGVLDLKFSRIHLDKTIVEFLVVYGQFINHDGHIGLLLAATFSTSPL